MLKQLFGIIGVLCLLSSSQMRSQSLFLKAKGQTENETKILDSLDYESQFEDYESLNKEIYSLKTRLEKIGFLESQLEAILKENDSTFLALFDLGEYYKFITIYYKGLIEKKILSNIASDVNDDFFTIGFEKLEESLNYLNPVLAEKGNPFLKIQIVDIQKNEDLTLRGTLTINNQNDIQRTIDEIVVKGYEKFPTSFIKHYLKLKPKQLLNIKTINRKTSDLDNLAFANQIREPELLFTQDSTSLYIYVEKANSNTFDGFLGFGTNDQTGAIEFDGYLNLNLINNLNYGESLKLLYKSDENEQRTFDIKVSLPYVFGSPLGTEFKLNIFRKDSTFITTSQSAKLIYQFNSRNSLSAGINSIISNNLLENSTFLLKDYNSTFYILNYLHQKNQKFDALFPTNFLFDISVGTGKRTVENITEPQTSLHLDTFKIFNLNIKNSLYFRLNGGSLISDDYLENELLRFGGINSIRGFEENSLNANLFTVLNSEYRYRVSNNLYIHSVLDIAYSENQILDSKSKLLGLGFGFGLLSKAGLFKLNYSSGSSENQQFRFSNSKIHISLSSTF
ncbi:outer membrane protein assembly factor BamA [Flavobacteriaceae bacterium MAR_2010_72]|nr:outer membrane protein assembly factor BamA [Flavobacteriaceae bacterium MAR_2010_72]TVZ58910.1 outer membrane protein assembly factor BamA [Flavobacteriaceae bacterium MAR_2010_105]